ncbi:MAG: hypothetical protein GY760_28305 [Deltaproteobacteria bacterium]|nr:hypothetical protein [Deltaproteobacteria bacterium]
MFNYASDLRMEILLATDSFSSILKKHSDKYLGMDSAEMSKWLDSFQFRLEQEKKHTSYSIIHQILINLPFPDEGVDRESHYRSEIGELIDHLIIQRINNLRDAHLNHMELKDIKPSDENLYNELIIESSIYIDNLNKIKSDFLDRIVEFILTPDDCVF